MVWAIYAHMWTIHDHIIMSIFELVWSYVRSHSGRSGLACEVPQKSRRSQVSMLDSILEITRVDVHYKLRDDVTSSDDVCWHDPCVGMHNVC